MSRYASTFINTAGPGDARPTAMQVIEDEGRLGTMKDKVFLITGCSAGLGIETARACAATGAKVFVTSRDLTKGQQACASFLEPGRVELLQLDTSSMSSVRACAAAFLAKSSTLNVLICNAGIMMTPTRTLSTDGFELQLATNHLGHFLLFHLLRDALLRGSTPEFNSRLVEVSSSGHHASEIVWDDFQLAGEGAYGASRAYGQSKLAQIYTANYVDRVYGPRGLHALSLMPGGIATGLQVHIAEEVKEGWKRDENVVRFMKSVEQGAATTVVAALAREWEGKGGKYLEDCAEAKAQPLVPGVRGYKEYIYDQEKEDRLWKLSLETLGLEE